MVSDGLIRICVEEEDFFVVEKPPGIGFHDEDGTEGFFSLCKRNLCKDGQSELFPIHRLDKETSGLLILGRNKESVRAFSELFEKGGIQKLYIALSNKKSKKKQGTVKGDMERSRRKSWKLCKSMNNPAITQFFSFGLGDGIRLFLVRILTGKTHQIRVALKSQSSAIIGDSIYSGIGSDRVYLHAWSLSFTYKGKEYVLYSFPQRGKLWHEYEEGINSILSSSGDLKWPRI